MAARSKAAPVALGGVMAALATVIMALGTMIPAATYVCPMLCMLILAVVYRTCGSSIAWAWYGAVAILSLLMAPDMEAATMFVFLGYYPIVKPKLDQMVMGWLWKLVLFNASVLVMYFVLLHVFGMAQLVEEFKEMGTVLLLVTLLMGNVTFVLLDRLLKLRFRIRK